MFFKNHSLLGILVIVLFSSCLNPNVGVIPQNYLLPHEGNALKLKEKDNLSVSGGFMSTQSTTFENPALIISSIPTPGLISTNPNYTSRTTNVSFQAAYSPIKHLGIFGIHSSLKDSDISNNTIYHKSHLTGVGVGTYYYYQGFQRPPDKLKEGQEPQPTNVLFDLYAGYTLGGIKNLYVFTDGNTSMNFQKYYLQGGVHWIGRQVSLSYMMKAGKVHYTNGVINGKTHLDSDNAIFSILNNNTSNFLESSLKVDVTFKGVGIFGQFTSAYVPDFDGTGINNPLVHVGLVFDIHRLRKINN